MAKDEYHFERLTPINDIELKVYEDAINYVFENQDIKNVAISGAYSAGKSSVLESYKKKHSKLQFLHISLAHFQSPDLEETGDADQKDHEEKGGVKESVLEGKILNQLIHQIPSDKIPQTNFRVKRKIKRSDIAKSTVIILMLVLMILYFVFFKSWGNYVLSLPNNILKTILSCTISQYSLLISGIILTILLGIVIYGLVKIQKNKNVFRKLNFQGNEIEIFEESNDSYFDKYLNEVLYLFENAEVDAIVFEDMDRFNVNSIFERLREVNTLVNIRLQKDNKKIIRFFYLLRDDIFVSKDRTKFFDYIIPVVPVLDSSNSYDQFLDLLKKGGILQLFDNNFLQGLSLYIDDMRLLKNIYNEFVIYYNRINTTELDCNKMLAMITYKNLFPRDFSELQLNQGFVFTLFNKKDEFIVDEIAEIEKEQEKIRKEIEASRNEHLTTMRELNAVFADRYFKGIRWTTYDNDRLSDFVMNSLSGGSDKDEYLNRRKALEEKLSGNISQLEKKVYGLEQKKTTLKNKQLYQLINRNNINKIFSTTSTNEIGVVRSFKEIKSSEYFDLLKYLIRNGYIDETYTDYMTYFYENSLSRSDKIFLRSVTDKKAKVYTYQLKNPKLVVSRLRIVDFDQEETLNYDLFAYLLKTPEEEKYLNRFIHQLKNTRNYQFIGAFFDTRVVLPEFIRNLNIRWPEILADALDGKTLSENQLWKYSIYTLYYSDADTIRLMNSDNAISEYISNDRNYLAINDDVDIEKLIAGLKLLKVKFKAIDYEKSNKALFQRIYEESLYEINSENIQLMLHRMCGIEDEEAILHKNYTLLRSISNSPITQYVEKYIAQYLEIVLEMCKNTIRDSEEVALIILNEPDIASDDKKEYALCLSKEISHISLIEDTSLWSMLLNIDAVSCSEENIMTYFEYSQTVDRVLASFINRSNNVSFDFSNYNCSEQSKELLFISLITCDDIENIRYEKLLSSFKLEFKEFSFLGISDEKIDILIKIHIIPMTTENLVFMRNEYLDHVLGFINENINQYVDIMDDEIFSLQELLEVLKWKVSDEIKIQLMSFTNQAISIINENYSTKVCIYILENIFLKSDLPELLQSYDKWDKEMQAKIYALALTYIFDIIANPKNVSSQLKNRLLYSRELNIESRIDLLIAMLSDLDMEYVKPVLAEWGFDDYIKIFDNRSRPRFEISPISKKILEAFKKKRWIQNYEEDGKKPGFYKIIKRKAPKELPKELL